MELKQGISKVKYEISFNEKFLALQLFRLFLQPCSLLLDIDLILPQCVCKSHKVEATNFLLFAGGCSTVSSSHSLLAQFGFQLKGHVFMVLLNLSLFHSVF